MPQHNGKGQLNWYGPEFEKRYRRWLSLWLNGAAHLVRNRAQKLIGIAGTGRSGKGRKAKQIYGANPSKPGEPPRKQRGRLRSSVAVDVDVSAARARVGTGLKYGRYLELGTQKMAARPWLRRSLNETKAQIREAATRVWNQVMGPP